MVAWSYQENKGGSSWGRLACAVGLPLGGQLAVDAIR